MPALPWTRFYVDTRSNRITLFTVEYCESCNGEVMAPNSVHADKGQVHKLLNLGLKQHFKLPANAWHNNFLNRETCDNCDTARCIAP